MDKDKEILYGGGSGGDIEWVWLWSRVWIEATDFVIME